MEQISVVDIGESTLRVIQDQALRIEAERDQESFIAHEGDLLDLFPNVVEPYKVLRNLLNQHNSAVRITNLDDGRMKLIIPNGETNVLITLSPTLETEVAFLKRKLKNLEMEIKQLRVPKVTKWVVPQWDSVVVGNSWTTIYTHEMDISRNGIIECTANGSARYGQVWLSLAFFIDGKPFSTPKTNDNRLILGSFHVNGSQSWVPVNFTEKENIITGKHTIELKGVASHSSDVHGLGVHITFYG